jgi:hypothetical protein
VTLADYPYFADFEPKKRELYETASETGKVTCARTEKTARQAAFPQSAGRFTDDGRHLLPALKLLVGQVSKGFWHVCAHQLCVCRVRSV